VELDGTQLLKGSRYRLYVGIVDPLTKETGITLTMKTENEKYLYFVCEFQS